MSRLMTWTTEMLAWLGEHYGSTDIHELTRELNDRFGCEKTETAVYVKANKLGLHRPRDTGRHRRAERAIRWSKEPEMAAFMVEHDKGSIPSIIEKFRERFGITLTRNQVTSLRTARGTQSKAGRTSAQDWHRRPIGYERDTGKGYVLVKVRDDPEHPGTKDNWEMKHVLVWERTRGLKLPDGWIVLFCDGDHSNYDPANLKAVSRQIIGVMNNGPGWSDRATCEAAVALAMVKSLASNAIAKPRRCGVCGREFIPDNRAGMSIRSRQRTCRECLDKGLRAPKDYGEKTCPECGKRFHARSARSKYCSPDCRARAARKKRHGVHFPGDERSGRRSRNGNE